MVSQPHPVKKETIGEAYKTRRVAKIMELICQGKKFMTIKVLGVEL